MIKSLTYYSQGQVRCLSGVPSDVIICVPKFMVCQPPCAPNEAPTPDDDSMPLFRGFINGTVNAVAEAAECSGLFVHQISYDTNQLIPGFELESRLVLGVACKGPFNEWFTYIVGNEPTLVKQDDGSYTYTSEHGCTYFFDPSILSLTTVDTHSVDLSLSGTNELSANVKISSEANNVVEDKSDGLYATYVPNTSGPWWPGITFYGDGSDGDLHVTTGVKTLDFPARDMYFHNLTIDVGATFRPIGISYHRLDTDNDFPEFFKIFVSGTLTLNGTIDVSGDDAPDTTDSYVLDARQISDDMIQDPAHGGLAAGPIANPGPGGAQAGGGRGGGGVDPDYSSYPSPEEGFGAGTLSPVFPFDVVGLGQLGGVKGYALGGNGGAGGAGGNGAAGGTTDDYLWYRFYKVRNLLLEMFGSSPSGSKHEAPFGGGAGGAGGGGGGATALAKGGAGGGGGAGGATLYIRAKAVSIGSTGLIDARGGDGGNGANGSAAAPGDKAGGGGGGGAGGGGFVGILASTIASTGHVRVDGGVGGNGGSGVHGYPVGVKGADGLPGYVYVVTLPTGALA